MEEKDTIFRCSDQKAASIAAILWNTRSICWIIATFMLLPSSLPLSWTFLQPLLLLFLCFLHHCILFPKQDVKSMPICMEITLSNTPHLPPKIICLSLAASGEQNVCLPCSEQPQERLWSWDAFFPQVHIAEFLTKTSIFRSAKGSQLLTTDISDTSKIKEAVKSHFLCAFRLFLVTRGTSLMMLIIIYWTATTCSVTYKTEHELTTSTRWVMQIRNITANPINT